VKIIKAFYQ